MRITIQSLKKTVMTRLDRVIQTCERYLNLSMMLYPSTKPVLMI
jgi:hypothetical protein